MVTAQEAATCLPLDRRLPHFRLRSRQLRRLVGQRFVLRCDGWERGSVLPAAHLVRTLGRLNDARCARPRRWSRGLKLWYILTRMLQETVLARGWPRRSAVLRGLSHTLQ